ncbi:MAG: peptide chain release factor N(5)-glutamine methyltransferase [Acholeplasmatales bacterium]|nr:MAG: peptide chain release factor N(5)-glutamine methyltransferase [Acholeplasmatales bacterium]
MPTYKEALNVHEDYALNNDKEPSAIRLLMLHISGYSGADFLSHQDEPMDEAKYLKFRKMVDEYVIAHRPVQHITECETFYGYRFCVNHHVLIPRFETEELVGYLLDLSETYFTKTDTPLHLLDVGTGSGCLAITLALENPRIKAQATEISPAALDVAKRNADSLQADVLFHEGNLLDPVLGQTFDILVSNPPYIPNKEVLDPLVKDHEPHLALFGGEDGLDFYRAILKDAERILNPRYIIAFEHAYDKARELKKLCKKYLSDVCIIQKKDMQGKDRMTFVLKKG